MRYIILINISKHDYLEKNKRRLSHFSEEHKAKQSASMKGKLLGKKSPRSVPIIQLTMDGEFVKQWDCLSDVERELGIGVPSITHCCRGRQKSAGGFKWTYAK